METSLPLVERAELFCIDYRHRTQDFFFWAGGSYAFGVIGVLAGFHSPAGFHHKEIIRFLPSPSRKRIRTRMGALSNLNRNFRLNGQLLCAIERGVLETQLPNWSLFLKVVWIITTIFKADNNLPNTHYAALSFSLWTLNNSAKN